MKKKGNIKLLAIFFTFILTISLIPNNGKADTIDIYGGIKNEYTYEEVVFLSGKPIVFTGTNVKVTKTESKGKLTEKYSLKLKGPNNETLSRSYSYVSEVTNYDQIGQSTANGKDNGKLTESIKIDGVTYTLSDYQLSKGQITDKRAASDYFSGNALSRKTYTTKATKTEPARTIIVNIDSRNLGYENFWGATETQITDYEYVFDNGYIGHVKNRVSTTKSRVLNYEENAASLGSFNGGYAVISSSNSISEYTYNMPSGSGSVDLQNEYMPRIERLIVPKFRDLSSHWAKDAIEKLYSLGILDDQSNFFSPNTPMQRFDFAIAIGKAVDLRVFEDKKKKNATSIFKDVKRTAKDYNYLVSAYEKGIIAGTSPTTFNPQGSLTREQAATIMIRALGLENKAPDPGFKTNYKDDKKISNYARDAVYVIGELGLMTGDPSGNFKPKANLTRAEASSILVRFLEYLENDLKQNYRDDILFFD